MIAKVLGYQGIPTTRTVREWLPSKGEAWRAWTPPALKDYPDLLWDWYRDEQPSLIRERTVVDPIYVVPQMLPCPECGGDGLGVYDCRLEVVPCQACGGSGVVAPPWPDYIATGKVRVAMPGEPWFPWRDDVNPAREFSALDFERRQVVAYKVTATEQLPVAHWRDELPRPNVSYGDEHPHGRVWVNLDDEAIDVTDEPWAADLRLGDVVWRLHLEALDQPYTEMRVPCSGYPADTPHHGKPCKERPGVYHARCMGEGSIWVPLSVPVGEVTELELVELAR